MPAGRPPKFSDPEEMEKAGRAFFRECDAKDKPYTVVGLALALGMDRKTLIEYGNRDKFSNTVKKLKAIVEQSVEERLYKGQVAGPIFSLKCNYDWKDTQHVDVTTKGKDLQSLDIAGLLKQAGYDTSSGESAN